MPSLMAEKRTFRAVWVLPAPLNPKKKKEYPLLITEEPRDEI
jgi:hypothetical protein